MNQYSGISNHHPHYRKSLSLCRCLFFIKIIIVRLTSWPKYSQLCLKSNSHKSNNRLSRRSFPVLFSFLCLRPVGRRRHYVFGLSVRPSVRPSVRTRISLTRNLKNPLVDFHHTWPRGAPWRVDELIRFWARSAQGQRSKVNELGLNMLFLPR